MTKLKKINSLKTKKEQKAELGDQFYSLSKRTTSCSRIKFKI